jgi:hypothetical protein
MELIIKQDKLDLNRIKFKHGKKCIKIIYDLTYIKIIGITLKINEHKIKQNDDFMFINLKNTENISILQKIDGFLKTQFNNYISFINNDIIKVKKHINFKESDIYITLNNIKNINNYLKVQIFSI